MKLKNNFSFSHFTIASFDISLVHPITWCKQVPYKYFGASNTLYGVEWQTLKMTHTHRHRKQTVRKYDDATNQQADMKKFNELSERDLNPNGDKLEQKTMSRS